MVFNERDYCAVKQTLHTIRRMVGEVPVPSAILSHCLVFLADAFVEYHNPPSHNREYPVATERVSLEFFLTE